MEESKRVKLVATEGMILTNGESYGRVVYLAAGDSPDNWQEITLQAWQHKMEQEAMGYEEDLY